MSYLRSDRVEPQFCVQNNVRNPHVVILLLDRVEPQFCVEMCGISLS